MQYPSLSELRDYEIPKAEAFVATGARILEEQRVRVGGESRLT